MHNSQTIIDNIKRIANEQNISLSKLAVISGLGKNTITSMTAKTNIKIETLTAIAKSLNVSINDLTGETQNEQMVELPILGEVSAGFGVYADNDVIGTRFVPQKWISGDEPHVLLKVKGDSMIPKFEEGDIVLVRCQASVDNGSYAVVMIDGENGVIKRVIYDPNSIELQSLNPIYAPRRFEGEDVTRLRIFGLVRKIAERDV